MQHVSVWQRIVLSGKTLRLCGAIWLQIWMGQIHTMSIRHRPDYGSIAYTEIEYHLHVRQRKGVPPHE